MEKELKADMDKNWKKYHDRTFIKDMAARCAEYHAARLHDGVLAKKFQYGYDIITKDGLKGSIKNTCIDLGDPEQRNKNYFDINANTLDMVDFFEGYHYDLDTQEFTLVATSTVEDIRNCKFGDFNENTGNFRWRFRLVEKMTKKGRIKVGELEEKRALEKDSVNLHSFFG